MDTYEILSARIAYSQSAVNAIWPGPDAYEALKSGALVFHCNTCKTDWPPSSEDIAKLRKQFSKDSD